MGAIRISKVVKRYGKGPKANQVIHGVSVDIADGEFIVIVGPSGCGKSTLLDLLALALAPDPGGRFEFLAGERPQDIAALWRDGRQDRLAALRRRQPG